MSVLVVHLQQPFEAVALFLRSALPDAFELLVLLLQLDDFVGEQTPGEAGFLVENVVLLGPGQVLLGETIQRPARFIELLDVAFHRDIGDGRPGLLSEAGHPVFEALDLRQKLHDGRGQLVFASKARPDVEIVVGHSAPRSQKKGCSGLFLALSCTYPCHFFGVAHVQRVDAFSNCDEVVPFQPLHVFERPVEALEDREAVD
ncbi:hypothetical protein ACNJYC_30430 [Bradyrhizobium sp. DASA03007]|uniref:hypothetical protein n=1 Tax=Bradyrhizobium sp. SPXBL-03 TaxID=3395913 RepID=UPI003F72166A